MYAPPAFRIDSDAAFDLIDNYGFATLITADAGRLSISHLPMFADQKRKILRGHLARANPHAALLDGRRHIAVFAGPDAYVSPDWYDDAEQVPTWNYVAAHVTGSARVFAEPTEIDAFLVDLSDRHEQARHDLASGKFWTIDKLPPGKLARLRNGIVAFEITIENIEAKAKLSQNKPTADVRRIIERLFSGNERQRAVADAMRFASGDAR